MTQNPPSIDAFLATVEPFCRLSADRLALLGQKGTLQRYQIGEDLAVWGVLPSQVVVIYEGQARELAINFQTQTLTTVKRLERGAVVGAVALVQGKGCEAAIASTEMTGFVLPAQDFLDWVEQDTEL
ncbi:MAG: hypothetical protein SFW36_11130, partial [Leptolyngbyaceae cyanobacterium bins.59]|nr:hypothetical protein [Leptolyngbyaceae cyanobacterium bins.59]